MAATRQPRINRQTETFTVGLFALENSQSHKPRALFPVGVDTRRARRVESANVDVLTFSVSVAKSFRCPQPTHVRTAR
jgi:hypothetical protein